MKTARLLSLAVLLSLSPRPVSAQPPAFLWMTNLNARVFATDAQTNVYADAGGKVIQIDSTGTPLQTNLLSQYPGMPLRDAAGSYYYAGKYPGTPAVNGFNYTNPACFVVKFDEAGGVLWSNNFGPTGFLRTLNIRDIKFDPQGNSLVAYTFNVSTVDHFDVVDKFDTTGSNVWSSGLPKTFYTTTLGSARLGPASGTNAYALTFASFSPSYVTLDRVDNLGAAVLVANWTASNGGAWLNERPIANSLGEFYEVEGTVLAKRNAAGELLWTKNVPATHWTVGQDQFGGVHAASDSGDLARYDFDGNQVWSTNLASVCNGMVSDSAGNRFVSLLNGVIGRLADESLSAPFIATPPQAQTVLAGSNVLLSVTASGSGPLRYFWRLNGNFLPGKTNSALSLTNVDVAQAGLYSVVVSNFLDSMTSAPALLRVKRVALFAGNQLLTNGTYVFASAPALSIRSAFPNGSAFYTLDGSAPSFASTPYSAPFNLTQSATVRALGYSADFQQSEEADSAVITVLVNHKLTVVSSGGGRVTLNPPGGTYLSTNVVTATAVASNGWSLLYWLGDAAGTNTAVNLSMDRDRTVQAVFGTTLATTVAGNGQILQEPPGPLYAYGSTVRLTAMPQTGNYFGSWGNAASGNTNPLYFSMLNPTQTVSSIFGALPAGQVSLTVLINGGGRVTVNPRANAYPLNQTVDLSAVPDSGQFFFSWTGDATGSQNPLSVSMSQSRVITANFSGHPSLRVSQPGLEGLIPEGFRFTLLSAPQTSWQILGSTNLNNWDLLGTVTNTSGTVQFTDPTALGRSARFYRALLSL